MGELGAMLSHKGPHRNPQIAAESYVARDMPSQLAALLAVDAHRPPHCEELTEASVRKVASLDVAALEKLVVERRKEIIPWKRDSADTWKTSLVEFADALAKNTAHRKWATTYAPLVAKAWGQTQGTPVDKQKLATLAVECKSIRALRALVVDDNVSLPAAAIERANSALRHSAGRANEIEVKVLLEARAAVDSQDENQC